MRLVLLFSLLMTAVVACTPADKNTLAERLYELLDAEAKADVMMQEAYSMTLRQMQMSNIPVQAKPFVEKQYAEMHNLMQSAFKTDSFRQQYIQSILDTYTDQELKHIVEFLESKSGKAYMDKAPEFQKKTMAVIQQQMMKISPQMRNLQQAINMEMLKYRR